MRIQSLSLAAALLFFTSCSQSEASSAAGTYTVDVDKTVSGILKSDPNAAKMPEEQQAAMKKMMEGMFSKMTMTLNPDLSFAGSAEISMMGQEPQKSSNKGTWSIEAGKLTMNQTHQDGKEKKDTSVATYKDGTLEVSKEQMGKKVTIYMKKK